MLGKAMPTRTDPSREDLMRSAITGLALPSLELLPDDAPDYVSPEYQDRFKDLLTAVNGRLLALGGNPLVASDWRLRGRYDPVPDGDTLTVGSMNDLMLVADDLGIDISNF